MRKINKILSLSLIGIGLISVTSCKGDERYPRSFTVNFVVDENCESIESQTVKEGYRIKNVTIPHNNTEAIFRGWYVIDEEGYEVEYFDIENYRVFDNITLKAKWTYPTSYPLEISLGDDAFTRSIKWIQKEIDTNDIGIRAKIGNLVYTYAYDANYDKNLISGVEVAYEDDDYEEVLGTIKANGNYQYTFTLDNPENVYYSIQIYSKSNRFEPVNANDIHFKGKGTKLDPYLVYSETDLVYLSQNDFDDNTYVKLMNDVTIHSIYSTKTNAIFNGHFDGNKSTEAMKTVDNYTITLKNDSGLFMTLGSNATITNINFRGSINSNHPSLGVVANYNYGYLEGIDSTAVSVKGEGGKVNDFNTYLKGGAGGIVGTNYGEITNCTVSSAVDNTINGHIGIGGVCGINYGRIHHMRVDAIVGAYNSAEMSTLVENSYSGCVAGINFGRIEYIDVYNGKINTRRIDKGKEGEGSNCVGGVVGYNAKDAFIENCLFDGMRIVGDTYVGGIAGYNDGTIRYCYTGRRLRKPSNTLILERQFISPVIGSYYVGGIAGKCGENSVITNVFSTANIWSYGMKGYTVAEEASNSIGVMYNQHQRASTSFLGQKFGVPYSTELTEPNGERNIMVDNSFIVGKSLSWGLGYVYDEEQDLLVKNEALIKRYLTVLGDKFGFREGSAHGIRLMWESSVKSLSSLGL